MPRLIAELEPTHIFNCHVPCAFTFTDEEIRQMHTNLADREHLYADLFPWDHPNYGLDEQWVRPYPYEQNVTPGETVTLHLVVTNHSAQVRIARCRPILPESWDVDIPEQGVTIPPKQEGYITFSIPIPTHASGAQRTLSPLDVTYDEQSLGQFREAIFVFPPDA